MADFTNSALLVTGASGQFGQLALEELLARGATRIIAGTREPDKLRAFAERGVEVRRLDFDDKAGLPTAFSGAERVLMISTDTVGTRVEQHRNAVEAATAANVRHITYTSAPSPRPNQIGASPEHYWTEQMIVSSGLEFALLRNHIYSEMVLMAAGSALKSGQLLDATAGLGRSYVSRADAARTAAGALLGADGKAIHDVTGPAAVTQEEVARLLTELSGKGVARVGLDPDALRGGMLQAGLPPGMVDVLVAFDEDAALGYHAVVTDAVEQFSRRKPQSLADVLQANRAALAG